MSTAPKGKTNRKKTVVGNVYLGKWMFRHKFEFRAD